MKSPSLKAICFLTLSTAGPLLAGSYNQNFNTMANGTTGLLADGAFVGSSNGPASVQNSRLRLTQDALGGSLALYRLADLDAGSEISGFDVQFDVTLAGGGGNPADGFSLNFGALPLSDANGPGEEGYQLPHGMVISFDTYVNGGEPGRTIDVRVDGTTLVTVVETAFGSYQFNGVPVHVTVHWDANGLDVIYGTYTVCNNLAVPGLVPQAGDRFAWSGRTGGATEDLFLDDVAVTTTPLTPITLPGLAISEIVVDNKALKDEHCQTPGWVELYNGTAAAVSLNGWSLTDVAGTPAKWPFPAGQTVPAYGYLLVYLGYGIPVPVTPDTRLHTNFTLAKTGGYLGLFQGATARDSLTFGPQFEDVSYGHMDQAWTLGFIEIPTPLSKNRGTQEANGPITESIVWPRDGGLITGPISLVLGPLTSPGAQIRYTLDNTVPTATSLLYNSGNINVTTSTNVRARAQAPGYLPGPVSSRTFLKLDSSLTNYRGTGQPFSSNLPIIVIDSFGRSLDAENSTSPGSKPYRPVYSVVMAPDPANGNRSIVRETKHDDPTDTSAGLTRTPVDFQGRGGMHVRGESSSGMPQRQYAWETWDNQDKDKSASILGLPADSDWVLYAPATDKTLLRNFIAYSTMMDTNGESSAMRVRFVEVFFNQPALGGVSADTNPEITYGDYRGVYVLVERIKRGNARVDVAKLDPCDTDPSLISGGYIFKKDKASSDPDLNTTNQNMQVIEPLVTPGDAQWTWLQNYLNTFEGALYGGSYADPVTGYRAYIDETSFMDNQWWVEIYKQIDGYRLSTYFHKDRGQKIKAAPIWDYNLSGGNGDYLAGWDYFGWYYNAGISQTGFGNDYQYYGRLRSDPGYTLRHYDRYWKLRKTTFKTSTLMARIDAAVAQVTDGQPTANIKNSLNWDVTNYNAAANPPQLWPNSVPSVEVPAARHHARWQRLGIYDWPNAPGRDDRDFYVSSNDAANLTTLTSTPYNITTPPAMSEIVHYKAFLTNRLQWMDDAYLSGSVVVRPPVFSQDGGSVAAGFNLTITGPPGAPPPAANYGLSGSLVYQSGQIFYTTNGSDPILGGGTSYSALKTLLSDTSPVQATVPSSAAANADNAGKDWKALDFNYASTPVGVTWFTGPAVPGGPNGVGYDDSPSSGGDYNPELAIRWNTATNNNTNAGLVPRPVGPISASNVMARGTVAGTFYNGNSTCYIRIPLNLTAADRTGITALHLFAKFDDGIIVWLNGVRIADKFPPVTPAWNSTATSIHEGALYEELPLLNMATAIATLQTGPNILAIQGLNGTITSNDVLIRVKLLADGAAAPIVINSSTTVKARSYDSTANRWSPLTEATFTVATVPASASNIVVSEIMYNPSVPTIGEVAAGYNNDNMFEYIELMNISSQSVDMGGVTAPTGFTFNWPTGDVNLRILGPGERAVIVGNAGAFNLRYAPGPGVKVVGVFDGNLGNGGEHLQISGPGGIIKDFTYDDAPPWPTEADGAGYSLVLNNPLTNPNHNLAINWRASFQPNGTPGTPAGPASPSAATALLDDDNDGMSNLLEYATGTLGNNGASQHWPATAIVSAVVPPALVPDDFLTFSYIRSRTADGFSFEPESSSALNGWQPLANLFTFVSQTSNADGTSTLTWRSTQPAATLPSHFFLRVRATLAP